MICVATVVDSISPTSMAINEFVIYRSLHNYDIKQVIIDMDNGKPQDVSIPDDVEVLRVGTDRAKIRDAVKKIKKEYGDDVVFHMHQQKSAVKFCLATLGMGIRKRSIFTVHSTYSKRNFKYKLTSIFCVLFAKYADCVSYSAYGEYNSFVRFLKGKKFFPIQNGVDVERIDSVIDKNIKPSFEKIMVCVARIVPLKNHDFLVDLLAKLPEYKMVFIGAEDKEKKIRNRVSELGLSDRVEFKGLMPREDVFRELQKASVYVSASLIEGLPISVLEAMRVGLVPVLSDIAPHKEIAEKCSLVEVLPLDVDLWAEKIASLNDMEAKSRKIRNEVGEKFSLDVMHGEYMKLYKNLVK